jgi:hypothetical protein
MKWSGRQTLNCCRQLNESVKRESKVIHMKAEFESHGEKVEVDFSEMEKRLLEKLSGDAKANMEAYFKEAKELREAKGSNGKGIVEAFNPDQKKVLLEEFKKGSNCDTNKIKEQWTICVPKYAVCELAGHLRDYVWVTDAVKGKAGETVNIPIVKDLDFAHVSPKTGTFTATTGLINVLTTTLHESGAYYDAYYGDIEKIDSNMLDELNRVFAHAAVRAEDLDLVALMNTGTTGQFLSYGGGSDSLGVANLQVGTNASAFTINMVVDALACLMQRGKEVHPGECIMVMRPKHYQVILKAIIQSTPLGAAKSNAITQGIVEDFLGVKIIITNVPTYFHSDAVPAVSSYQAVYLLRPKRALALAPKRDILIETDKLVAERQLRIAASHTYGVAAIDYTEIVPIINASLKGAGGG